MEPATHAPAPVKAFAAWYNKRLRRVVAGDWKIDAVLSLVILGLMVLTFDYFVFEAFFSEARSNRQQGRAFWVLAINLVATLYAALTLLIVVHGLLLRRRQGRNPD